MEGPEMEQRPELSEPAPETEDQMEIESMVENLQLEPEPEKQPEVENEKLVKSELSEPQVQLKSEPNGNNELEPKLETEQQMDSEQEKLLEPEDPRVETEAQEKQLEQDADALEPEKQTEPEVQLLEPEPEKQEGQQNDAPAAPGSFAFALLDQEHTKAVLLASRTLIVLRGLPGSGKSRLACAISDHYQGACSIVCADDHGIKPEKYAASDDGHKSLDNAVVACFTSEIAVVVVDDTNHTYGRLARLGELAEQHQYSALFLEPRTEWCHDIEQLVQKNGRGLDKAQMQLLKVAIEETSLPLLFGWFLYASSQNKLSTIAVDFLKILGDLDAFKKHLTDFIGEPEKAVDLEQYFQDKGVLHCTTKFCEYGKAEGAKEYAEKQSVKECYGSTTELAVNALFFTPCRVGAKVSLTEEQLKLWPADGEKDAVPGVDLLPGSCAHITLGYAEGVEPVQTGQDLLELVQVQQQSKTGELVQELEMGPLSYYGKGMWVLNLHEPCFVTTCFTSYYGQKKEALKMDKKKKPLKCTIQ